LAIPRFELVSGPDNLLEFKEYSTTQTFVRGDIVGLTANTVSDVLESPITANSAMGVAAGSASGVANTLIPVQVISGNQVWRAFAPAATAPTSLALGIDYEVDQAAAAGAILSTGTTTTCVVIYKHEAEGKDGSAVGQPLLVKFEYDERQMESGDA
jgi:hypothetical protein